MNTPMHTPGPAAPPVLAYAAPRRLPRWNRWVTAALVLSVAQWIPFWVTMEVRHDRLFLILIWGAVVPFALVLFMANLVVLIKYAGHHWINAIQSAFAIVISGLLLVYFFAVAYVNTYGS